MTRYCRKIGQTEIYIQTPHLMKRKDIEECEGPTPEGPALDFTPKETEADPIRIEKIKKVVLSIDPADYSKAGYGRPAMPKISVVSERTGFKVTSKEIIEAMETQT